MVKSPRQASVAPSHVEPASASRRTSITIAKPASGRRARTRRVSARSRARTPTLAPMSQPGTAPVAVLATTSGRSEARRIEAQAAASAAGEPVPFCRRARRLRRGGGAVEGVHAREPMPGPPGLRSAPRGGSAGRRALAQRLAVEVGREVPGLAGRRESEADARRGRESGAGWQSRLPRLPRGSPGWPRYSPRRRASRRSRRSPGTRDRLASTWTGASALVVRDRARPR